jgi:hypothetical protein
LSKKLAKQVKNCDKKLKEMLMQYNSYRDSLSVENRQQFKELQTSDLRIEVEGLLIDVEDETDVAARIPYSVRRQAIDMRHLLGRSKEEIKLVEEEMNRVFLYYQNEERKVSTRIEQLSSDNNNSYTIGSISLLKSTQKILQHRLLSMHTSLKIYVTLPNIEFSHSIPSDSPVEDHSNSSESCPEISTDDSDQE